MACDASVNPESECLCGIPTVTLDADAIADNHLTKTDRKNMKTHKKGDRLRIPRFGWIVFACWSIPPLILPTIFKDLEKRRIIIPGGGFELVRDLLPLLWCWTVLISTLLWAIRYCSTCSTFAGFDEQGRSDSTYERHRVNKEFAIRNKKGEKIGGYDVPTPAITHSWAEIKACRHCGAMKRESKSETRTKY